MKRFINVILLFVLICGASFSQQTAWQWVSPLPQGNPLNGVWPINDNSVIAVGAEGTVIRSSNSGVTWQVEPTVASFTDQLLTTQFVSSNVGWAACEGGVILKTTNGGASWFYQDIATFVDLFSLYFISDSIGWVGGYGGTIFHTTDGGETWVVQNSGVKSNINAIQFRNSLVGWAAGADTGGIILKTVDGGVHWTPQRFGKGKSLFSLSFVSDSVGWVVGAGGTILKTTNAGATWTSLSPNNSAYLYTVHFISALSGWAAGSYGVILKTTDGGVTWTYPESPTYNNLYAMRFTSTTHGWAVGDYGVILTTTDGGSTWGLQSTNIKADLFDMSFLNSQKGWAVGDEGTIVKTTDNGISWVQENSGTYVPLYSVYFLNDTTGWAVGDSGVILRTDDGGMTWIGQDSRRSEALYNVFFYSAYQGWAVGDAGVIVRTTTGGLTWIADTLTSTSLLYKVAFYNPYLGWVAGESGTILRTTNGGLTWLELTTDASSDFYDIEVITDRKIIASGDFGTIAVSNDSGSTWTYPLINTSDALYGVSFYSTSLGWVVGDEGTILITSDGGNTWEFQNSPSLTTLLTVNAVRYSTGGLVFIHGLGNIVLCSSISPLPPRIWTGASDSLWINPANWNPTGIPNKIDSVVIVPSTKNPHLTLTQQQLIIGSLTINSGAKLTIGTGLAQLVVQKSVKINGTLQFISNATTNILVGENFLVELGGKFDYGKSTVVYTQNGKINGSFYNVIINQNANVNTVGNVFIKNSLTAITAPTIRSTDTLTILSPSADAFDVYETTGAGTVKRAILQGSTDPYYFESSATAIAFDGTGIYPDTILVTSHPNSLPPEGFPSQLFVKRYYDVKAIGGNNYKAIVCLRYDDSETSLSVDDIGFFRDSSDIIINVGVDDVLDSDFNSVCLDSARQFYTWYLGSVDYLPQHPFEFDNQLIVSDNGSGKDTLLFGAALYATNKIDSAFDEVPLGVKPPFGTFDARWRIDSASTTKINIQNLLPTSSSQNIYKCEIQPGPNGYPFLLSWDSTFLPIGLIFLQDGVVQQKFSVNMKTQSSYSIADTTIKAFYIVHVAIPFYHVNKGWNLISVPVVPTTSNKKSYIFPTATTPAYTFTPSVGYVPNDQLQQGPGIWVKFREPQKIAYEGYPLSTDTITVADGWNIIGSISKPVALQNIITIPAGIRIGNAFGFNKGYFIADSIQPAQGYWFRTLGGGKLVLSSAGLARTSKEEFSVSEYHSLNLLSVDDKSGGAQTLYFGRMDSSGFVPEQYDLPPLPPNDVFDARFESQRFVEQLFDGENTSGRFTVLIQSSHYPITLHWNENQKGVQMLTVTDEYNGSLIGTHTLKPQENFSIQDSRVRKLLFTVKTNNSLPKEFALFQNYPNPFNPSTTIQFDVPKSASVTLKIYNILGQEVLRLLNNADYEAGKYSVNWNASNFASGVYFYQLVAKNQSKNSIQFQQVKKLVLIK